MWRLILLPFWLLLYFGFIWIILWMFHLTPLYLILVVPSWIQLYLLGWILIPLAAVCKAYTQDSSGLYHFTWPFMAIYDNKSDGIACNDYWPTVTNMFKRIWLWSAVRNPLASITMIPYIHCAIDPLKVRWIGSITNYPEVSVKPGCVALSQETLKYNQKVPCWYVARQGLFSCIYWQFNWRGGLWLFWAGAKIKPTDIYGVEAYRKPRTYNTVQFNQQA
jgi:hypothetical protein